MSLKFCPSPPALPEGVNCLLFVAFSILLSACGGDFVYKKTVDIPGQSWDYEDTLKFDFEIADTAKIYALLLDVTHTPDYGFQNLYVRMHTRFPSGKEEHQVVSLELASKSGVWNGKCSRKSCTVEIPLQAKTFFKEKGAYRLAIEQYMRQSPLPGLVSMQLAIRWVE